MFGVLLVKDEAGKLGYLRGFSGSLAGQWQLPGFVPPLFDMGAREAVWPAAVAELADLSKQLQCLHEEAAERGFRQRIAELPATPNTSERKREKRQLQEANRDVERRCRDLKQRRTARSCAVFAELLGHYVLPNALGERGGLPQLFTPKPPPGGAGDCAAPKLLAWAYRARLQPLAVAEFWWGASPKGGSRASGTYYAACSNKCGPVLGYMMQGLGGAPARG